MVMISKYGGGSGVLHDERYLKLDATNGPLTGALTITPDSGDTALIVNKDLKVKMGQKLYLDYS